MSNCKGKHILYVCNYYAPDNTIAAIRSSKLVKHFKKLGYDVDVLTEKKDNMPVDDTLIDDMEGINVFYVDNSDICKKICKEYAKIIKPHKDKRMNRFDNRMRINKKTGSLEFNVFETMYPVIGSLDYIFAQIRQQNLAKRARKVVENEKKYDYVLTSYGDSFAYFYGMYFKKKHPDVKWIFDIRDAIYNYKTIAKYVKFIAKSYENKAWESADLVVGVSHGICDTVSNKYKYKANYISNGFEYYKKLEDKVADKETPMRFTYTGSMYGGIRDLSEFYRAVKELIDADRIDENKLEFVYAGNPSAFEIFKSQAAKYQLDELCEYFGKVSRKEALQLQYDSDVLLLASFDYADKTISALTGKVYEYMSIKRPVITIVVGDGCNSELTQIINETNIGISYECTQKEEGFNRLKEYIAMQYERYINGCESFYNPVQEEVEKYNYANIVKRYIELIEKL